MVRKSSRGNSKQKRIAYALAHKGAHKDIYLAGNVRLERIRAHKLMR